MDPDKKSLIKSTIIGLLAGGTISALHTLNNDKDDGKQSGEFRENEIVVPLSRRNFMKSVRGRTRKTPEEPVEQEQPVTRDVSGMAPNDLASLKRSILLGKAASCCDSVTSTIQPISEDAVVQPTKRPGRPMLRDQSGRFAKTKTAGALDLIPTTEGALSFAAGAVAGHAVIKMIGDKILIDRAQGRLNRSRRRYADMISKEVNDDDAPYYKKASNDSALDKGLGLLGTAGIASAGVSALVMYKIMENRRIAEEKAMDKDMDKYPKEKNIRFEFTKDKMAEDSRFFR